ncbi:hypothetical protein ACFX15_000240 [Malus domestica]
MMHNDQIKNFHDISRHVELEGERRVATQSTNFFTQGGSKKGNQFKGKGKTKFEKKDAKLAPNSNKIKAYRGKHGKKDESKSTCFNCKKKGHFTRNCTEPNKKIVPSTPYELWNDVQPILENDFPKLGDTIKNLDLHELEKDNNS